MTTAIPPEAPHHPYEDVSDEEVAAVSNLQIISLLILTAVFFSSRRLQLRIERQLVIGAARCFTQVTVLGILLVPVILQNNPFVVLLFVLAISFMAAVEAALRPAYEFPGMVPSCFVAILVTTIVNGGIILFAALGTMLNAQYAIPLSGMIAGESMEAVAHSLSYAVQEFVERKQDVEMLVAMGASRWEACFDIISESVLVGIKPALRLMAVAGLVFVPELMTGHILGGTIPTLAGDYQVIVIFVGVGSALLSTYTVLVLTVRIVMDEHGRFREGMLERRTTQDRLVAIFTTSRYMWERFHGWRREIRQGGALFPRAWGADIEGEDGDGSGGIPLVAQAERRYRGSGNLREGGAPGKSGLNNEQGSSS